MRKGGLPLTVLLKLWAKLMLLWLLVEVRWRL